MPRNKIVGKSKKPWWTKATWRDYKKEAAYNKSRTDYRAKLNKAAREKGIYWKRYSKGVDLSHTTSWKLVLEKRSTNRARNWMKKWKSTSAKRTWTKKRA